MPMTAGTSFSSSDDGVIRWDLQTGEVTGPLVLPDEPTRTRRVARDEFGNLDTYLGMAGR